MKYEICKRCNGLGVIESTKLRDISRCPICKGTTIIHRNTGLPPDDDNTVVGDIYTHNVKFGNK